MTASSVPLVSDEEFARLEEALRAEHGRVPTAELHAVAEWVGRTRLEFALAREVLSGHLTVRWIDGHPVFRRRELNTLPASKAI